MNGIQLFVSRHVSQNSVPVVSLQTTPQKDTEPKHTPSSSWIPVPVPVCKAMFGLSAGL